MIEGSDTLTWDGNKGGLEHAGSFLYKVSDATPSMADLANGCHISQFDAEEVIDFPILIGYISEYADYINVDDKAVIVLRDGATVYFESYDETYTDVKKGTYFFNEDDMVYTTKLQIPGYSGF